MLVASRLPVPVAILPWRTARGRATLIAKVSFDYRARGVATLSQQPDPLSDEVRGPDGTIVFPSDFVHFKEHCDVLVVGRALVQSRESCRLVLPGISKQADRESLLGPRPARTDDEQPVQQAAADQRTKLELPVKILLERGERSLEITLPGPVPQLGVMRGQELDLFRVTIDTIAIDPERSRILVTARTIVEGLDTWSPTMFVTDILGMLTEDDADEPWGWPQQEIISAPQQTLQPGATTASPIGPRDVAPTQERTFGRTVPIVAQPRAVVFGEPPTPSAANSHPAATPGVVRERAPALTQRMVVAAPPSAAVLSRPRPPPVFVDDDESTMARGTVQTIMAAPASSRPVMPFGRSTSPPASSSRGPAPLPPDVEGITLPMFADIERELGQNREDRTTVLRRYNLGELRWRLVERRWLEHLVAAGLIAEPRVNEQEIANAVMRLNGR